MAGVLDVCGASPRRFFFKVLHHFAADPVEADRLAYFASPDGREALAQYNQREGVDKALLYIFVIRITVAASLCLGKGEDCCWSAE